MSPTKRDAEKLGALLLKYCEKYYINSDEIFLILEDQKVTPMIRGKATEFNAIRALKKVLPKTEWSVQKLNLNPQPTKGASEPDIDIKITFLRNNKSISVESKSAKRGSMKGGPRCQITTPHFRVKIHKSRSHLTRVGNDRYALGHFDILITHPLNAIYQSKTIGENLELIHDSKIREILYSHYGTHDPSEVLAMCAEDWRFCVPENISVNGFVPREPTVKLAEDENWRPLTEIEGVLKEIVRR